MSDNVQTTPSTDEQTEKTSKPDNAPSSFGDVNTPPSTRLFGQFKQNGFGFNNVSAFGQAATEEKSDSIGSPSTYFTNTLSKLSSTPTSSGFGSPSVPLAASLASLGANKPLFGGSSTTAPSSFTDLKASVAQNKKTDEDSDTEENEEKDDDNKATLLENVAEYEAKRASIQPIATIQGDTSTGEENEITKFQIAGKLFMYSGEQQQFVERGYGILKINESHDPSDWDRLQARLIMRLDKSFRVILNSPIFPKMTVERVTDRSVRFGAQDETHLRVFIIKASSNDCNNFCKELQSRIDIIERQQVSTPNLNTSTDSHNSSVSSDVVALDDSSSKHNLSSNARKRSHSKSDSDSSENTNDLSKRSKVIEGCQETNDDVNQSTNEDKSIEKTEENQEQTANN